MMRSQIADRWQSIQQEVAGLATQAGRDPSEITIIAVTKNQPIEALIELAKAGCRHIGENRIQEAALKKELAPPGLTWHLIGTLQSNKLKRALTLFDWIHSIDRLELAQLLPSTVPILLQVNVSGEESKHGWSPQLLLEQFQQIESLNIQGLMTMAPQEATLQEAAQVFAALRRLRDSLATPTRPLPHLSMGMSRDYPAAIAEGATLLRLGSVLFTDL
jgi:PLP dependent protein